MGWHSSYKERKYDVGQRLLTLRTKAKLTQAELATLVGVTRRSIQNWETSAAYPKEEALQRLLAALLARGVFTAGQEREEAVALWELVSQDGAHRLALFDEVWFAGLLTPPLPSHPQATHVQGTSGRSHSLLDWGEAINVPVLYGRDEELATLHQWVLTDGCRVVALLGLGGIGKSSLAITFANQAAGAFDAVCFRSLRNAPRLGGLLDGLLHTVSAQPATPPEPVADKITLLIQHLREQRCLLVLDNLETILQPGATTGDYRAEYADYGTLIQRLGEVAHQSCLLLTSREKPVELGPLEGRTAPVRTLPLAGLTASACQTILQEKDVYGSNADCAALAHLYGGNPLALKLVSEPIRELFDGDMQAFLAAGDAFFNGVGKLLEQQLARSTPLEQVILYWLAIARELVPLATLRTEMARNATQRDLLVALESLRRRLLIERGADQPGFTLQPVILEYMTDRLVGQVLRELGDGQPALLHSHALVQATAKDYVRHTQERLIATPLLEQLRATYGEAVEVERRLIERLQRWRGQPLAEQGYGPGNVVNLLRLLRGHLRGIDLSRLALRNLYLQAVEMQDSNLAQAMLHDTVFTESFNPLQSLSISGSGEHWATGDLDFGIRVYEAVGRVIHRHWQRPTVTRIALSPDGRSLAGGAFDGEVHCWDVASVQLKWSAEPGLVLGLITQLAFSPDGRLLAVASNLGLWLWDAAQGTHLATLPHPAPVPGIVWNREGTLLASGDATGMIRFWAIHADASAELALSIQAHSGVVTAVAFSPAGDRLASGSWDGTVKVWNVADGSLHETLVRHQNAVQRVTWSGDGQTIAYSVRNEASWLWDVAAQRQRAALRGHTGFVRGLLFTPDSRELVSACEDGSMRVWDVATGACNRAMYGYSLSVRDMSWSPDGAHLAVSMSDPLVTIHALSDGMPTMTLHGHMTLPFLTWSPDGRFITVYSADNLIDLRDAKTGETLASLFYPDDPSTTFFIPKWSPNGKCLAAGTSTHGVQLFDIATRTMHPLTDGQIPCAQTGDGIRWSPDGVMLAVACEDDTVGVWDVASGALLLRVPGERWSLAWNGDSTQLAVVESRSDGCEVVLWNITRGVRASLCQLSNRVHGLVWIKASNLLITAGADGCLSWWDVQSGECERQVDQGTIDVMRLSPDETMIATGGVDGRVLICDAQSGEVLKTVRRDRPYERMDITGLRGVTEAQKESLLALGAIEKAFV